jgi:hypothetical protein
MKKIILIIKKMLKDPRAIYYYSQRAVRPTPLRVFFARIVAWMKPAIINLSDSKTRSQFLDLDRDGYVFVENVITAKQVQEMKQYLENQVGIEIRKGNEPQHKMSEGVPADCRKLYYQKEVLLKCPHVLSIANDPTVLSIVSRALNCRPTISTLLAWWSMPGTAEDLNDVYSDDMFHRDVDDLSFYKLFIYLTDVDDNNGPHTYVKGSHKSSRFVRRGTISNEDVEATFGKDKLVNYTGAAGTVFIENTWGIHRGTPLKSGRRLIFQVLYSLTGMNPTAPEAPINMPLPSGMDLYINRVYVRN